MMTKSSNEYFHKINNLYQCNLCDYNTSRLYNINKHLNTKKHKDVIITKKVAKVAEKVAKVAESQRHFVSVVNPTSIAKAYHYTVINVIIIN
jgi:hypothetical protein